MELDIVARGRAEKEKGNLHREGRRGDRDQRLPESICSTLRIRTSVRRTGGRLTQVQIPMEKGFNSYPRETPTVYIQSSWDRA